MTDYIGSCSDVIKHIDNTSNAAYNLSKSIEVIKYIEPVSIITIASKVYYMTGRDIANNIVYWISFGFPNFTPTLTQPALSGSLVDVACEAYL